MGKNKTHLVIIKDCGFTISLKDIKEDRMISQTLSDAAFKGLITMLNAAKIKIHGWA